MRDAKPPTTAGKTKPPIKITNVTKMVSDMFVLVGTMSPYPSVDMATMEK